MKRLYFLYTFLILLAGCSKHDANVSAPLQKLYSPQFYATFGEADTRTYVDENLHQFWSKGDSISVFTSTYNQMYRFDGETGDNKGTFSAVSPEQSVPGGAGSLGANYALYPYSGGNTIAPDGTIIFNLPTDQEYAENTFAVGANPMVAITSGEVDTDLKFQNLCGFLRLRLYGDDVTVRNITLYSNYDQPISGKAIVVAKYDSTPTLTMSDSGDTWSHIDLRCGEEGVKIGTTPEEATDFWFVVPPTILENGFQFSVHDMEGGYAGHSIWEEFSIERNVVKSMVPVKIQPNLLETDKWTYHVGTEGGYIDMDVKLAGSISIEIPEQYKDWISYVEPTRAIHNETVRLKIEPFTAGQERIGEIIVRSILEDGSSCGEWKTIRQTDEIITVDKQINLGYWGGEFDVEVRDDIEFTVTNPDVNWLRPVEDEELPTHRLRYHYDHNYSYDQREAKILITNTSNNKVDTLTVTQAQRDAIILTENRYSLNSKGGSIEVEIGHNIEFDIEISDEWITQQQQQTRAYETKTLVFDIAPNTTFIDRKGTIKFISKDQSITQTVTIYQSRDNAFDPSIDDWESDGDDQTGTAE